MLKEKIIMPSVQINKQGREGYQETIGKLFLRQQDNLELSSFGKLYTDVGAENEMFIQVPKEKIDEFNLFLTSTLIPNTYREWGIPVNENTQRNIVSGLQTGDAGVFFKIHCPWYVKKPKSLGQIFTETALEYTKNIESVKTYHSEEKVNNEKVISFRKTYLSNFHPAPIHIGDRKFPTVEHAYQYNKIQCYNNTEIDMSIFFDDSVLPGTIKKTVDALQLDEDELRDSQKIEIMYMLVQQKFLQHEDLREELIQTGDKELLEGNESDFFWGVESETLQGTNYLGKILMVIRDEFKKMKQEV